MKHSKRPVRVESLDLVDGSAPTVPTVVKTMEMNHMCRQHIKATQTRKKIMRNISRQFRQMDRQRDREVRCLQKIFLQKI